MPPIPANEMTARSAHDAHLFFLEDGGVLFSESTQNLYLLNSAATFIWCQIESGKAHDEILAMLAETFRITP